MIQKKTTALKDGAVKIYSVINTAPDGAMPSETLEYKARLLYDERTVGVTRFYAAMQAQARVDRLLRCQKRMDVAVNDVAIPNDGGQYRITAITYPENTAPPVMDLTLELLTVEYREAENV